MGILHPSRSFAEPHPTVYETAWVARKNSRRMRFWRMKYQCLQDEGVDCSSCRLRAFLWDFEGSQWVP